jgi:hypothetical protein
MGIDGTQRVVQQNDVTLRVGRSGQTDPLLLTTTEIDALLSNLSQIPTGQELQISFE